MEYKDYYKTLGVSKTATEGEIKTAYRKLARRYHPDVNKDPQAEEKFKELNEAYQVLSDPEKRKSMTSLAQNGSAINLPAGSQVVLIGADGSRRRKVVSEATALFRRKSSMTCSETLAASRTSSTRFSGRAGLALDLLTAAAADLRHEPRRELSQWNTRLRSLSKKLTQARAACCSSRGGVKLKPAFHRVSAPVPKCA